MKKKEAQMMSGPGGFIDPARRESPKKNESPNEMEKVKQKAISKLRQGADMKSVKDEFISDMSRIKPGFGKGIELVVLTLPDTPEQLINSISDFISY